MTEFKIGDIVRMTKGEPDKPGYRVEVRDVSEVFGVDRSINLVTLPGYQAAGWSVELISRPAPPLPTKPNTFGWATVDGGRYLARLGFGGQWELYGADGSLWATPHPSAISDVEEAVLIPKKLADKIIDEGGEWHAGGILDQIADHLKGQDDE